ncbi:hypothetical protein BGX28_009098 [Mortierella sp. GBA30]|nr:hypothetical protein BGX28_009098 [Mortierella sp. GBA30]
MRAAVFFAFFMAMFAMLCSAAPVASPETSLEKRTIPPFDATVDLLVKSQADLVVKAFAEVCTDADVSAAVKTDINVQISGLINVDFGLGSRLSAALHSSIKAAVKAEVDAEVKAQFTSNLHVNVAKFIGEICPNKDAKCIKKNADKIVAMAIDLSVKASAKIAAEIRTNLAAKVKAAVDLQVKKFSVNLWLIKVNVTGAVDVSSEISTKFKAAAGIVVKACASIKAKLVAQVKALC